MTKFMNWVITLWIVAFIVFVIFNLFRINLYLGLAVVGLIVLALLRWLYKIAKSSMRDDKFYTHRN